MKEMTSLGFARDKVPVGTHICLVYTTEEERCDTMLKFLLSGITGDEKSSCFSEKLSEETLRTYLREQGISYDERKSADLIRLCGTSEVYFQDGRFDPERMLNNISAFYAAGEQEGRHSRIIGEMTEEILRTPGGERLMEYESRVTLLVREKPVTTICQYDASAFDGAMIMEILRVHPQMIVNGTVVNNPFFIEPEVYLAQSAAKK
ncbi:MAG: MEDS domain-containing protein [Fibrobacterota bacterium]